MKKLEKWKTLEKIQKYGQLEYSRDGSGSRHRIGWREEIQCC